MKSYSVMTSLLRKSFLICGYVVLLIGAVGASGQTAADFNEGLKLEHDDATGVFTLSWWGKVNRSYFVQTSLDMMNWSYLPLVEAGLDEVNGIQFSSTEMRQFWRLRYTDQSHGGNPEIADFDADGVQNLAEVTHGTDPFSATDADADGLPDDWETFHFGNLGRLPGLDKDGDGFTDAEEFASGTNPRDWRSHPGEASGSAVGLVIYNSFVR